MGGGAPQKKAGCLGATAPRGVGGREPPGLKQVVWGTAKVNMLLCAMVQGQVRTLLAATTCGGYKSGYKGRKWGYKGPKLGYK